MAKTIVTPSNPWTANSTSPEADQSYQDGDRPEGTDYIGAQPYFDLNSVQFPRTMEDATASKTIFLTNAGTKTVTFNSYSGNSVFAVTTTTGTIAPAATISVLVEFSPTSPTSDLNVEIVTFLLSEGANNFSVPIRVSGSKVTSAQSAVSYGSGGILNVTASNTKYTLTADVTKIYFDTVVSNSTVDLAGFNVNYSTDHGVEVTSSIKNHCEVIDSTDTSELIQTGSTSNVYSFYLNSSNTNDFYILGGMTSRPSAANGRGIDCVSNSTPTGLTVDGFKCISTVTSITSRHQLDGYMVRILNAKSGGDGYAQIKNMDLQGGCQGGIWFACDRSQSHDNVINHTSTYTNGFAYLIGENFCDVWDNDIGNGTQSGRGIMINKSDVRVWGNTVNVKQDRVEVDGNNDCYGLQCDPDDNLVTNSFFFNNDVTATAISNGTGDYGASAIKYTSIPVNSECYAQGNTLRALRTSGSTKEVRVIEFNEAFGGFTTGNILVTDEIIYSASAIGVDGNIVGDNTILDGTQPAASRYYMESKAYDGWTFVLNSYNDDFSSSTMSYSDIKIGTPASPGGVIDITVSYDVTTHVRDSGLTAISGASVSIDDAQAVNVASGVTSASGDYDASLIALTVSGLTTASFTTVANTPHLIDITASGFDDSLNNSVTADAIKTKTITMSET